MPPGSYYSPKILRELEKALAHHSTFGDSNYIRRQLQECFQYRLKAVSTQLSAAGELLQVLANVSADSAYRAIGNTVVRCAIVQSHTALVAGISQELSLSDCEAIFAATARHLREGNNGSVLEDGSLQSLGLERCNSSIWSDEHSGDIFGRTLRHLLRQHYAGLPTTPTTDESRKLAIGAQLLNELLPTLTPSVLVHAQLVACVPDVGKWEGTSSSSQFNLGGTVFLNKRLGSPWWVAEHLFHESIHQKLYDFRHGHILLELEHQRDAPKVWSPWNADKLNRANRWDVARVFAAFHVYVHVALLAVVAEQQAQKLEDTYGPLLGMIDSRKALDRAHYLGEQLKGVCWSQIGPAGRAMLDWLISTLELLDPSPPPKGVYAHLCLDLYEREASQVASALELTGSGSSPLAEELVSIAKRDIESARSILRTIDADGDIEHLTGTFYQYAEDDLGAKFSDLRHAIATVLLSTASTRARDELIKQMVETSSLAIHSLLSAYPPGVAEAKRRATELRFRMSCRDDVGRLLAVLAASVPSKGRILEIGTGVGVGTAWLISGVGERNDIEVITVENDQRVNAAARERQWPSYVQFISADASRLLETLGSFDLIFVDAAPVKYNHISAVLRMIRPGGFLVADDLGEGGTPTVESRGTEIRSQVDAFCRSLRSNTEINAVEMKWSTGILLASKKRPAVLEHN